LSSESEDGRREIGTTESGAAPRVVPVRDAYVETRERGGGGGEAALGNEDNQEASETSLGKLVFKTISAQYFQYIRVNPHLSKVPTILFNVF
jgi:hypothetical protein